MKDTPLKNENGKVMRNFHTLKDIGMKTLKPNKKRL
ncbi:hypothetical protein GGR08_000022 [Bartonella fuyuanensis]|uniref:Uncharacterized protein n=1 Tax=Bartonella fuyuanensis TaxID=1460968 RepID=A0A840DRK2_9HYPH|nr:hypothetical protein [Bartonella fuyuanensis]